MISINWRYYFIGYDGKNGSSRSDGKALVKSLSIVDAFSHITSSGRSWWALIRARDKEAPWSQQLWRCAMRTFDIISLFRSLYFQHDAYNAAYDGLRYAPFHISLSHFHSVRLVATGRKRRDFHESSAPGHISSSNTLVISVLHFHLLIITGWLARHKMTIHRASRSICSMRDAR